MSLNDLEGRIAAAEARLARFEAFLSQKAPQATSAARPQPSVAALASRASVRTPPAAQQRTESQLIGNVLGWGGAIALLLAASYLIRLAIDSGWLTPLRQIACAAIFGLMLIGSGFALRRNDRDYAGLLPAAGIAVLFLTIYGGHLYHHLIGVQEAGVAIIIVCGASLWLCRAFQRAGNAYFSLSML
jgi:uncharacterized membrane protein